MGLSIKNAEVERMARDAAKRRGVSMTEALRQVLAEEEARVVAAEEAARKAKFEALMAISRRGAAPPDRPRRRRDHRLRRERASALMVIDSSALVAIVTGEAAAAALDSAVAGAEQVIVPTPCLVETGMVLAVRLGPEGLSLLDVFLAESGAGIAPFTEEHARLATDAFLRYGKGRHAAGLNFGDCVAYAVAQAKEAPLLFTGNDFARTDVVAA